jgi:hypothetical protein
MRHARRNGHGGLEFGGSGEDSFVAVVVTKLTGALLFILLLTMVIMALLPKAVDLPSSSSKSAGADDPGEPPALTVTTPETLPEAIAGRPYVVALAAAGGRGPLKWSVAGALPEGLDLDAATGRIHGTPAKGTPKPAELVVRVSDGSSQAAQATRLVVYQSDRPLTTPAWWKPGVPPVPWRAWLEQGFGFLLLWLVYLVGMNTVAGLRRWSLDAMAADPSATDADRRAALARFALYRWTVRLSSLSAAAALAAWLVTHHA